MASIIYLELNAIEISLLLLFSTIIVSFTFPISGIVDEIIASVLELSSFIVFLSDSLVNNEALLLILFQNLKVLTLMYLDMFHYLN